MTAAYRDILELTGRIVVNPHGVPFRITGFSYDVRAAELMIGVVQIDEHTPGRPAVPGTQAGLFDLHGWTVT